MSFAGAGGWGGINVVNLFALRATDPAELKTHPDPVGPDNDLWITNTIGSGVAVAAWGANAFAQIRAQGVLAQLNERRILCLGRTKSGAPRHPLYVPKAQRFEFMQVAA